MSRAKKQSYIKKLRILKEKHGFTIDQVTCNWHELDWHKWERFTVYAVKPHIEVAMIKHIEQLFKIKVYNVFGDYTSRGISLLLESTNTYYKK